MISDEYEEDLDDLDLKEFKSEDSDEDEGDVYKVADQLGILGNVQEDQMQAKLENTSEPKKNTDEHDKTIHYSAANEKGCKTKPVCN